MTNQEIHDNILRNMSPKQKLQTAMDLYYSARALKENWLKKNHPSWTAEELKAALVKAFTHA